MFANYPIHATLPATDMERARRFYTEQLGLTAESEAPEGVFYRSGDTRFLVFPSGGTASGAHTQLSWTVDDIETEVAALKARGVNFEEYDLPELSTINGVALMGPVKMAWMKDSEGNLLSVAQFV
jgi:catechol 2,3-dioxygenase-like lactoylglutathione lyase family enzyme